MRRYAALLALAVLLAAGCGGGGDGADGDAAIDLTVTVWPDGEAGDSVSWTLECEPTGGDHPDRDAACAALTPLDDPFGEVPPPERCEEIPGGGPEVGKIEGDFRGRAVSTRFTRESACVLDRWDRIAPVFPTGF